MQKNKKIFFLITLSIFICILISIVSITYAYFLARVENSPTENNILGNTSNLSLQYKDGSTITGSNIIPGWSKSLSFKIENTGDSDTYYKVVFESINNPFSRQQDLRYTLSCSSSDSYSCSGKSDSQLPSTTNSLTDIVSNNINPGTTHTYTLTITYKNDPNVDQSLSDKDKNFSAKVTIVAEHESM